MINLLNEEESTIIFNQLQNHSFETVVNMITEQISSKKDLMFFGQYRSNTIEKELEQLIYQKFIHGKNMNNLIQDQKHAALWYLMF